MGIREKFGEALSQSRLDTDKASKRLEAKFDQLLEALNEQTQGIVTIYQLLEVMAKKAGVDIPKPLINMDLEEDKFEV